MIFVPQFYPGLSTCTATYPKGTRPYRTRLSIPTQFLFMVSTMAPFTWVELARLLNRSDDMTICKLPCYLENVAVLGALIGLFRSGDGIFGILV
jgi:hypothetical protein